MSRLENPVFIVENNQQQGEYSESPLENAFNQQISQRFRTYLHNANLNKYGTLVRVTSPTVIKDRMLVFQYHRFNLFHGRESTKETLIRAFSNQYPNLVPKEIAEGDTQNQDAFEVIDAEVTREEKIIDLAKQTIINEHGEFNQIQSLINPLYINGLQIQQWPESLAFAIFNNPDTKIDRLSPVLIDPYGSVQENRPDFYGSIYVPPFVKSAADGRIHKGYGEGDGMLYISFPKIQYITKRAEQLALDGRQMKSEYINMSAAGLIGRGGGRVDVYTGQPLVFAEKLGRFIEELCIPLEK